MVVKVVAVADLVAVLVVKVVAVADLAAVLVVKVVAVADLAAVLVEPAEALAVKAAVCEDPILGSFENLNWDSLLNLICTDLKNLRPGFSAGAFFINRLDEWE